MQLNKIHTGSALEGLKQMPDNSVHCIVTSPPYWGLRDYGVEGQLGMEKTPEEFVQNLVAIFHEAKRALRNDGTLWVNLGDSYAATNRDRTTTQIVSKSTLQGGQKTQKAAAVTPNKIISGLKPKDLVGTPWMVAFALRADGWYLRQDIIWSKPNPMPESVTDRCTKSHEYIFLLSKSPRYYYDQEAIKQPIKDATVQRMLQQIDAQAGSLRVPCKTNGAMKAVGPGRNPRPGIDNQGGNQGGNQGIPAVSHKNLLAKGLTTHSMHVKRAQTGEEPISEDGRANKKSVWNVATKPFSEAHFATFPQDLIVDCIKAGCPVGGVVLDPFMGAGTTALVAAKLERNFIGFELNPKYVKIAERRLYHELGLFTSTF